MIGYATMYLVILLQYMHPASIGASQATNDTQI